MQQTYINPFFYYPNRNWLITKDTLFFLRCYVENGLQPFSIKEYIDITNWIVKKTKQQTASTLVLWDTNDETQLIRDWQELLFEQSVAEKDWQPIKIFKSKNWKKKFDKRLPISNKKFLTLVKNHRWLGHYGIVQEEDIETTLLQVEGV